MGGSIVGRLLDNFAGDENALIKVFARTFDIAEVEYKRRAQVVADMAVGDHEEAAALYIVGMTGGDALPNRGALPEFLESVRQIAAPREKSPHGGMSDGGLIGQIVVIGKLLEKRGEQRQVLACIFVCPFWIGELEVCARSS